MKDKLLEIYKNISSEFGKSNVKLNASGEDHVAGIDFLKTPSRRLNKALGLGGLPYGRITEIYGPESGGKTTLLLGTIAIAQRLGKLCAFIDAEHSYYEEYARACGVDVDNLLFLQPDTGEEAVDMAKSVLSRGINLLGIDSVAAMVPKAELDGTATDANMGLHPRLMGKLVRVVTPHLDNTNMLIVINQIRMKLGVMFGNPETTTGGNALKFFSSVRLDVRVKEKKPEYNDIRIKVVKNKVGKPFGEVETRIIFGSGVDEIFELVDALVESDLVEARNGGWYILKGEKLCQGKDNFVSLLRNNVELRTQLESALDILESDTIGGEQNVAKSTKTEEVEPQSE